MTEPDESRSLEESMRSCFGSPCLPQEFLDDRAEDAWMAVLGSKRRIKELADKLRKLKIETPFQRKQLRLLPDAILIGVCYSLATFSQQLSTLVTPQQYDSMSPRTLTRRFVVDLLGTRIMELGEILSMRGQQNIKERICGLLPEAQAMFDQGWGSNVYPGVLTLAYLLEIANFNDAGTESHYQACFALNSILIEMLHTPIMSLTLDRVAKHPGYRAVYAGLSATKLALDYQSAHTAANPVPLAISLSAALKELAVDVLSTDACSVLKTHELLFSLSGPGHQGLRKAAEEYVEFHIRPRLYWVTNKAKEALTAAGITAGVSAMAAYPEAWSLIPTGTPISAAHFRVLQSLIGIEDDQLSDSWDKQIKTITEMSVEAAKARTEIFEMISHTSVDPVRITAAAERLNAQTTEITSLSNSLIVEINNVISICDATIIAWNSLVNEQAKLDAPTAHLSESASREDKEMLVMALEESQSLRAQLQDSLLQVHQLGLKAGALEHHQDAGYTGPVLDPGLTRKIVSTPSALTPVEVLTYIQHVGGRKVRVLQSAWRSAEDSAHFELSERMLDLLDKLVFQYAPSLASGRSDAEAREILGANYSAKESESVESNPTLRFERTFMIEDQEHYFCRHLLVGNDPGRVRGMRIHFDILDGVVVIAYAGKHLRVASTN